MHDFVDLVAVQSVSARRASDESVESAHDVLERARPQALRYFLGAPHYRSDLDWSEEGLVEADAAYSRLENFIDRATETVGAV